MGYRLKTTYTEEHSSIQIQKVPKILNSKQFCRWLKISVKMFTIKLLNDISISKVVIAICFSDDNSLTHWINMPKILIW